jgi:hypothetical protein
MQTPMSIGDAFNGFDFRTNEGPEGTDYFFAGHLTAVQIAETYYAIYPEHRTRFPYTVDPGSVRHTWTRFTEHADDCYLVTGDEEPGPLNFEEFYICCTCHSAGNSEVGTGYEYRHAHPATEGQSGAIPVTWVSIPMAREELAA